MTVNIDEVDKAILKMLQEDARIPFRKIAEKAGVSEATIFIRVKKLQKNKVIKKFTALVSPELLGKNLTAFILINTSPKMLQLVLNTLKTMEEINEIYDVTGTYYVIAKIITEDREKLAIIIDKIGLIEGIIKTETAIVLRCIKEDRQINP
jgi:Lrp/AsnC family transcriptional regulator for asnA, asnC and gidA